MYDLQSELVLKSIFLVFVSLCVMNFLGNESMRQSTSLHQNIQRMRCSLGVKSLITHSRVIRNFECSALNFGECCFEHRDHLFLPLLQIKRLFQIHFAEKKYHRNWKFLSLDDFQHRENPRRNRFGYSHNDYHTVWHRVNISLSNAVKEVNFPLFCKKPFKECFLFTLHHFFSVNGTAPELNFDGFLLIRKSGQSFSIDQRKVLSNFVISHNSSYMVCCVVHVSDSLLFYQLWKYTPITCIDE
mmetsp:Transcript_27527/g.38827  ORF Transcript_27527/g.38827 Transcript_27527/m.38827 type:complete len:243 (-) Transcript_27527:276-1004(-)